MVRAIASHKFLNDSAKRSWGQAGVWNAHRIGLLDDLEFLHGPFQYDTLSIPK